MLAGALAAGGYGVAEAASSGTSGAATTHVSSTVTQAEANAPRTGGKSGVRPRVGLSGHGRLRNRLRRSGVVAGTGKLAAITPDSITVATRRVGTRTIATTSNTRYLEAMSVVPRSALKVGDEVGLLVKKGPSAVNPAQGAIVLAAEIVLPRLGGRVTSISGNEIHVTGPSGASETLVTSSSTTYRELLTSVAPSAIQVGELAIGYGSSGAGSSTLDASTVAVVGPVAGGKVTAVSGSTITVDTRRRGSLHVDTTSSTIFRSSAGSASLSGVRAGDLVAAIARPQSANPATRSFTAAAVAVITTRSPSGLLWLAYALGWPRLGARA